MDYTKLKRNEEAILSLTRGRVKMLEALKKEAKARIKTLPPGKLRVSLRNGKPFYFLREKPEDKNGIYIRRADQQKAVAVAQRTYYEEVIAAVDAELRTLEDFSLGRLDNIPCLLRVGMPELVSPVYLDDDAFARAWMAKDYTGLSFDGVTSHFYTARGERVRSKSESLIADALFRQGVPYRYECPIILPGFGTVYPDFTCLNVRLRQIVYLEHFGMMDDPAYAAKAKDKLFYYKQQELRTGTKMIFLTESYDTPIDTREIDSLIERFLL